MNSSIQEPTVSISLTTKRAADALDFYTRAFGAQELYRVPMPDGGVGHAEFMLGNTRLHISDESEIWHACAMAEGISASCLFSLVTDDCDQSHARALKAGATSLMEPANQFWGKRNAMVRDPFGYRWSFSQKLEEVSHEEILNRARVLSGGLMAQQSTARGV